MPRSKDTDLHIRISLETKEKIQQIADRISGTSSQVGRMLIEEALRAREEK